MLSNQLISLSGQDKYDEHHEEESDLQDVPNTPSNSVIVEKRQNLKVIDKF